MKRRDDPHVFNGRDVANRPPVGKEYHGVPDAFVMRLKEIAELITS